MTSPITKIKLTPSLIIHGAARAIEFYKEVFDARVINCFTDGKPGGHIVHAELAIGDARFYVSDEAREWHNHAPGSIGGTPVIMNLQVPDVDAVAARLIAAGATVVYEVKDQPYGERSGRLCDPFGHLWLVTQILREMTDAEIQVAVENYDA